MCKAWPGNACVGKVTHVWHDFNTLKSPENDCDTEIIVFKHHIFGHANMAIYVMYLCIFVFTFLTMSYQISGTGNLVECMHELCVEKKTYVSIV